jgi:hypothetical protein
MLGEKRRGRKSLAEYSEQLSFTVIKYKETYSINNFKELV